MHSLIFKTFCNLAHVPKSCKLNIFSFFFSLFFLLIRIMYIKMFHTLERVESFHETQTGFSLKYQNIHTGHIQYKYTFLHKVFLKTNSVHPFLSDGKYWIHYCYRNGLYRQKQPGEPSK